tara:strand:+ start:170 stop:412 length:243 start_codon:yes stop_codon:yes gene_type:complete
MPAQRGLRLCVLVEAQVHVGEVLVAGGAARLVRVGVRVRVRVRVTVRVRVRVRLVRVRVRVRVGIRVRLSGQWEGLGLEG